MLEIYDPLKHIYFFLYFYELKVDVIRVVSNTGKKYCRWKKYCDTDCNTFSEVIIAILFAIHHHLLPQINLDFSCCVKLYSKFWGDYRLHDKVVNPEFM